MDDIELLVQSETMRNQPSLNTTKPTRVTERISTLIDNILCNNFQNKTQSGVLIKDISDHFPEFQIVPLDSINYSYKMFVTS